MKYCTHKKTSTRYKWV